MDTLNNKVSSTQDEVKFTAQNVGLYGYDSTTQGGKWRRLTCDTEGKLNIEATLELDTSGLAKEATLTDGTQKTQVLGNTEGDGSGTSKHIHLDGNGNVNSQIINTVSTNAFRTVIGDGSTNSHALVDSNGHVQVDVLTNTLPTGAATEATLLLVEAHQGNIENNLSSIQSTVSSNKLQVDIVSSALPTNAASETTLADIEAHQGNIENNLSSIQSTVSSNKLQTDVITSALPTGAATNATLTDGTQEARCMGNNSGSQVQIKVDANGVVETSGGGGGGGTQFAGGDSLAATGTGTAMIARDSGGIARLVATDTSGNLQIDIVANSDTTKATSTLQSTGNASLSSIDGKVATQTTLLAAEAHLGTIDTSTSSLAGCVSGSEVQVDIVSQPSKTTATQVLYTAGSATIASGGTNFQDFTDGTIGGATFSQLNVDGLGDVQYIIEGVGTNPQLTINELVGATSGSLFVSSAQQFASGNDDFAVSMVDSKAAHRGLRIKNTSGSDSYTVNKITAIYHTP